MAKPSSFAGKIGWAVGLEKWLDDDASKVSRYWRAIEYGAEGWVGGVIVGLWSNEPGVNPRPPGRNSLHGDNLDRFQDGGSQKFAPTFKKRGEGYGKAAQSALMMYFGVERGTSRPTRNADELKITGNRERSDVRKSGARAGQKRSKRTEKEMQQRAMFMLMKRAGENKRVPFVTGTIKKSTAAHRFYDKVWKQQDWGQRELDIIAKEMANVLAIRDKSSGRVIGHHAPDSAEGGRRLRDEIAKTTGSNGVRPRTGKRKQSYQFPDYAQALGVRNDGLLAVQVQMTSSKHSQDMLRTGVGFPHGQWQSMLQEINAQMAKEFNDAVVALMRSELNRRGPTGDLIEATDDPRNYYPH